MRNKVILNGNSLSLEQIIKVSREYDQVEIDASALDKIAYSRSIIDKIVESDKVVYGVNTGFGSLANIQISKEDTAQLQENLIRSHASGFGNLLNTDVVRAIMLIRINSLIKGYSGIRQIVIDTLVEMLNKKVHPIILEKGSLGASGDLAPLSHLVLPMIGLGEAEFEGQVTDGLTAMNKAEIPIIKLSSKEGLALINGTTVLTAIGALALSDGIVLSKFSDCISALTLESNKGIIDAFDHRLHEIRPHQGQIKTADNILKLTQGSSLITHQGEIRVQDPYSIRCIPQVHGATKDALYFIKEKVEIEINSVTDNPIVTLEGDVISGGNFHGETMGMVFDYLCIALSEIANISERRLERLVNASLSENPSFLVSHPGLNSGFMIAQYAAASLVSENKILSHPASVDSIPSSENQEDIVSMGTIAARKAASIVNNVRRVLATELMAAAQSLAFREEHTLGKGSEVLYKAFRKVVDFIEYDHDVQMYQELDKATDFIKKCDVIRDIEAVINSELF